MEKQQMTLNIQMWSCQYHFFFLEYSSNYSETRDSLQIYSKDEATSFNTDIGNSDNCKSFKCKAKLFRTTAAAGNNKILENITVAMP